MRTRLSQIVIGLCLLIPCVLVLHEASRTNALEEHVYNLQEAAETAPAGFNALRQVTDMRTQLRDIETDLVCERLKHLPNDAAQWHTTLIVQSDYETRPAEKNAMAMLDREPHLKALKTQTKFHLLKTDSPVYQRDFAKECPLTPCLLMTRADGSVIYKESGAQLGTHPRKLYEAINVQIKRHCPDGRCMPPLKFPDSRPNEPAVNEQIPDTAKPAPEPDEDAVPIIGCLLVGAGLVFYVVLKKDLAG